MDPSDQYSSNPTSINSSNLTNLGPSSLSIISSTSSIPFNPPSAKVLLDSISPTGSRVITLEVTLHRFVLAEFNTHRVFSRNSASSRAIPISKVVEDVRTNPAVPVEWGKNCPGMSSHTLLDPSDQIKAEQIWLESLDLMIQQVAKLKDLGVHKQIANRLLEPFKWHKLIVTSTEWNNFFSQRIHPEAQPEIRAAALAMKQVIDQSTPKILLNNQWHTPLILPEEYQNPDLPDSIRKKISVARCARVSYLNHHNVKSLADDLKLFDRLYSADPPHLSPFEHVCRPSLPEEHGSNLIGWISYRKELEQRWIKSDQ